MADYRTEAQKDRDARGMVLFAGQEITREAYDRIRGIIPSTVDGKGEGTMTIMDNTFEEAFCNEAGALAHRDGYIVAACETYANGGLVDMDGGVCVEIDDDETEGNRETDIPTISLITEFGVTRMTWQQARALAVAIIRTEGIARNG